MLGLLVAEGEEWVCYLLFSLFFFFGVAQACGAIYLIVMGESRENPRGEKGRGFELFGIVCEVWGP